jgi:menaquinone-dependent protoporphyrinogen oxidase
MRVLIVHASRYGSTQGIAERIAATLKKPGLETTLRSVRNAGDPSRYDAVVIGSAAYYFHWMKKATKYVRRHCTGLAERPVWLFSSGPLGTKLTDDQGRDVRETTVPKEIDEFQKMIHPREHRVFFGALSAKKLGLFHRLIFNMPAARDAMPDGDFRDWTDIDAWAENIVNQLQTGQKTVHTAHYERADLGRTQ